MHGVHRYTDRHRLPAATEERLGTVYQGGDDRASVLKMVKECDIVTINCPLYPATQHLFDREMLENMKKGSYVTRSDV